MKEIKPHAFIELEPKTTMAKVVTTYHGIPAKQLHRQICIDSGKKYNLIIERKVRNICKYIYKVISIPSKHVLSMNFKNKINKEVLTKRT